jgi:hypothetical protein
MFDSADGNVGAVLESQSKHSDTISFALCTSSVLSQHPLLSSLLFVLMQLSVLPSQKVGYGLKFSVKLMYDICANTGS